MLPESGGWQLNTYGATVLARPISSQRTPYSPLVRPGPRSSRSGRNRFHSPSAFARSRSSTRIAGNGVSRSTSRSSASSAARSFG